MSDWAAAYQAEKATAGVLAQKEQTEGPIWLTAEPAKTAMSGPGIREWFGDLPPGVDETITGLSLLLNAMSIPGEYAKETVRDMLIKEGMNPEKKEKAEWAASIFGFATDMFAPLSAARLASRGVKAAKEAGQAIKRVAGQVTSPIPNIVTKPITDLSIGEIDDLITAVATETQQAQAAGRAIPDALAEALQKIIGMKVTKPPAPVKYVGRQEVPWGESFDLWTLTEPIGKYPHGTTLSTKTIEGLGFILPPVK